ncbi:MAG: glycoside hydrolase family 16 protein [Spirochaetota bacterium]
MRTIPAVFFCLALICHASGTVNMMENPGAEDGTPSASYPYKNLNAGSVCADLFPDGWGFYNGAGVMVCGATSKEAHTGKNSFFMEWKEGVLTNSDILLARTDGYDGSNAMPAMEGSYYFSFYAKGNIPTCSLRVFTWKNSTNTKERGGFLTPILIPSVVAASAEWAYYEGFFRIGPGIRSFAIGVHLGPTPGLMNGHALYVDDVVVAPVSDAELPALRARLTVGMPLPKNVVPGPPANAGYRLVFSDEFNGPAGPPDPAHWTPWALGPRRDAVNVTDAAQLDGKGNLVITTELKDGKFTTGGVTGIDKRSFTRGYFEIRCRVQTQVGHWSAFWLQAQKGDWSIAPEKGGVELDVMEYIASPKYENTAMHTIHWGGYGDKHQQVNRQKKLFGLGKGYHLFAMEWTRNGYVFYTDGMETGRIDGPVSEVPQYLLLTMEVGTWAEKIQEAVLPDSFMIDYIRVWQKPEDIAGSPQ